jgi:uncharacterized membrane protein YeaQ/YmgE (transglycosylase-associated protein family)
MRVALPAGHRASGCYGVAMELWWGALSWVASGLLVGVIVRLLPPWRGRGWVAALLLAIAGALAGGLGATVLGLGGLVGLDPRSAATAALGALLALLLEALLRTRRQLARERVPLSAPAAAGRAGAGRRAG